MGGKSLTLDDGSYRYSVFKNGEYTVEHIGSFYKSAGKMKIVGTQLFVSDSNLQNGFAPINGELAEKILRFLVSPC